jgi:hypothetical protein
MDRMEPIMLAAEFALLTEWADILVVLSCLSVSAAPVFF